MKTKIKVKKGDIVKIGSTGTVWDWFYVECVKKDKMYGGYGSKGTGDKRMYYEWLPISRVIEIRQSQK